MASKKVVVIIIVAIIVVSSVTVWWFMFRTKPARTYSKYGISFDYPDGSKITEEGYFENKPTINAGNVLCSWHEGNIEYVFGVAWVKTIQYDIEGGLEGGFSGFKAEEGVSNLVRGARGESTLTGHTLHYQLCEYDMDTKHYYGIVALTYFDELEKMFAFLYFCEYADPLWGLQEILETFEAK